MPIRMAEVKKTKLSQGCGGTGILIHCFRECKMVWSLWKVTQFLQKLNVHLPHDLVTPRCLLKKKKNIRPYKDFCMKSQSFISNSQKVETTQVSTNRWTYKQTKAPPYNGIWLSNKKKWTTNSCHHMGENRIALLDKRSQATERVHTERRNLYKLRGSANRSGQWFPENRRPRGPLVGTWSKESSFQVQRRGGSRSQRTGLESDG